ncbi:MAG: hypothetical protein ACLUI7_10375 [Coprococcus sp.]
MWRQQLTGRRGVHAQVIVSHHQQSMRFNCRSSQEDRQIVTVKNTPLSAASAQFAMYYEREPVKVLKIGMNDVYGESGPAVKLLEKYGLDAAGIYAKIKAWL